MLRYFFITIFFLVGSVVLSEGLYRYIDEDGNEYIVDSPYKLPLSVKDRDKYIKEYEKGKRDKIELPPDLQKGSHPNKEIDRKSEGSLIQQDDLTIRKKVLREEINTKIQDLSRQLEETLKELGYKSQRALITQIPALKEEVENLKTKVEEIKKQLNEYYKKAEEIEKP